MMVKAKRSKKPAVDLAGPVAQDRKSADAPLSAREEITDFVRTALIAIILALLVRSFLYEPFNIPSGSMKPTLEVGDYLFVFKPEYGYSRHSFPFGIVPIEGRIAPAMPQRGDIIVFKLPSNTRIDYIKRVIGLPGDEIQVRNGRVYINNTVVERESLGFTRVANDNGDTLIMEHYIETLPNRVTHNIYEESDDQPLDNTGIFRVPEGHYFVMGDNRDNSQDSRVQGSVGYVPFENIVGKADFIFFSTDGSAGLFEVWKWPWAIRYNRFFTTLQPGGLSSDKAGGDE